jgi:flagellar hook-associated protein 1 FlgK
MASGFFNVGVSGLSAAQMGLLTTGHNIANASTEGYNRQYTVQRNSTPVFTGSGFLGTGTNVQTVRRVYSDFLATQVRVAQTNVSELESYNTQISQIDNLLADPTAGVSPTLQEYFSAVSDLSSTPTSIPARQAMLSSAQALSARFQAVDQQLTSMRDGVNTQINTEVTTINSMVTQIAEINQRIIIAEAAGSGQPANDMYDQRDTLINDLNKEIRITVQTESDGSYSLFFGTGQPLVVGTQSYRLKAQASPEDLAQLEVALVSPSGQTITLPESLIDGGNLGGLLQFRSQTLDQAQNSLGRVAMSIATTVNTQHQLGQDLQGLAGGNFFADVQPYTLGAPTNTGSAEVTARLIQSDYRLEYDVSPVTPTPYRLTRLSDNTTTNYALMPITVDGIRIGQSGGSMSDGDVFLIKPAALPQDRVTALTSNSGAAIVNTTGSNLQTLGTSDFRIQMTGTNTLTLTRISDGQSWSGAGLTAQAAADEIMKQAAPLGFGLNITGTMSVGDSFLIRPTRYAARDLELAFTDPRSIAASMAMRTGVEPKNGGTGTISNGEVFATNAALATTFTVRYESSSNSILGFPVGSRVVVGSQTYDIESPTTRVPFIAGGTETYKVADKAFSIAATPATDGPVAVTFINATPPAPSLPFKPITLTYRQPTTTGLPARLEGFPAGSRVTVTQADGTVKEYLMSKDPNDLTLTPDYVNFNANSTIEFNGMRFKVGGAPVEGDRFTVGPNPSGVGDARNLLAIGQLQQANTMGDGTATFQASYAQMVSQIGNKSREIEVTMTAQQNLVTQGQNAMQSASGVNLDEEAANLLRYQQAYQAAAKMMNLASTLFDEILAIAR